MKRILLVFMVLSLLVGCGEVVNINYPFVSASRSANNQEQFSYRAPNKTVIEVARELAKQQKPERISEENLDKMMLIYSKQWIELKKENKDTLILQTLQDGSGSRSSSSGTSGFFQGYLFRSMIGGLFDSGPSYSQKTYPSSKSYDYSSKSKSKEYGTVPKTSEGVGSLFRRGSSSNSYKSNSSSSWFSRPSGSRPKSSFRTGRMFRRR